MLALALGFVALGSLLVLWAAYEYLATLIGHELAALITGVCTIVVAGIYLWIATKFTR